MHTGETISAATVPADVVAKHPVRRVGVILHNMGGPTTPGAIRPFLRNLFLDQEIIHLPWPLSGGVLRRLFAEMVARTRTPKVRPNYEQIGGYSPIIERTREQATALERELNLRFEGEMEFTVRMGMRYWYPFTREALEEFVTSGIEEVFLLPLYPHFSRTTTGSSLKDFEELHTEHYGNRFSVRTVRHYHLEPRYIEAISDRIDATLAEKFTEAERTGLHLLFSAHGTPIADVKAGDPYSHHIRETVEAVMQRRGNDYPHHLSFQSRVGPVKWLEPYTQDRLKQLADDGVRTVMVVPIAFVTDHIETLHEIDIELREIALHAGIERYETMLALNDSPLFISALADVVEAGLGKQGS